MFKTTFLVLLLILLHVSATQAQPSRDMEKEKAIWAELETLAGKEIDASFQARRALQNLYELPVEPNPDLQQQIEESLNRETSEDDTHPCPNDRFRLTRKITGANELPATGMVWDLFKNREALTNEMTSLIQSEVQSG